MILNTVAWGEASGIPLETGIIDGTITSYQNNTVYELSSNAFQGCSQLTTISLTAISWAIQSNAFQSCSSLRTVYLYWTGTSTAASIGGSTFYGCWMLESLYLIGSNLKTLRNANAFASTPISTYTTKLGHNGSIFVPSSLLASYKAAANWSTYSARMVGLTDAQISAIKAQMGVA